MIHILGVKLGCFSVRGVSVRRKLGKIDEIPLSRCIVKINIWEVFHDWVRRRTRKKQRLGINHEKKNNLLTCQRAHSRPKQREIICDRRHCIQKTNVHHKEEQRKRAEMYTMYVEKEE